MCEYVSWIEFKDKILFLRNKQLGDCKRNWDDFNKSKSERWGHSAIRWYYCLKEDEGINKECTDFSKSSNFPDVIAKAIKRGEMIYAPIPKGLLIDKLYADYEKKHDSLEADYKKKHDPLYADYEKKRGSLYADYEKKRDLLLYAEYKKKRDSLYADYEKKRDLLEADYKKKRDSLEADYWKKFKARRNRAEAWR